MRILSSGPRPLATAWLGVFIAAGIAPIDTASAQAAPTETPGAPAPTLMTPQELQALPARAPDFERSYGNAGNQRGELRLPDGPGPFPVAVLVHGGCFKADYADKRDLAPMADALEDAGIASWNIEYRRLGDEGGGWPGTYLDVGNAIDHLRILAAEFPLDLERVVVVGHSAGGHLALWSAARNRVPPGSPLHMDDPLPIRGVVDLAGPVDLTANTAEYERLCRDSVITQLMGGTAAEVPQHYAQASPASLIPLGVAQVVVIGQYEGFLPQPIADRYVRAAAQAGDAARLVLIPGVGHFEIASPAAATWPIVEVAIRDLLGARSKP